MTHIQNVKMKPFLKLSHSSSLEIWSDNNHNVTTESLIQAIVPQSLKDTAQNRVLRKDYCCAFC